LASLSIDMPSDGRYKSGHLHIENTTQGFIAFSCQISLATSHSSSEGTMLPSGICVQ
jgi:hypothetical protein